MSRPYVNKEITDAVMDFWLNRCAFCGSPEVDRNHIVLFAEGGSSDDPANYILLCKNHHSLYHRESPSGLTFITQYDLNDVSDPKIIQKNKHTSSLTLDPTLNYRFRMGSFAFFGTEEILTFGTRPIIELYHTRPTSKATKEQSFLSIRFLDKNGEWIGSIIRNSWCGIRDQQIKIELLDIDKGVKVDIPDQDLSIEVKIKDQEIVLTGRFWWKKKRVDITEDSFKVDDQVYLERGVFDGHIKGLIIDDQNNLYFGPQFKIANGGGINTGPMMVFYSPSGTVSPIFLEKGTPLDISHGGGFFSEKPPYQITLSPVKFYDELESIRTWFRDEVHLRSYNIKPLKTEKDFKAFGKGKDHSVYVIKEYRRNIGMLYFKHIGNSPKRSEVSIFLSDKDLKLKFIPIILNHIKELIRGLYRYKYTYINVPLANTNLLKTLPVAGFKETGRNKKIASFVYENEFIK